MKEKKGNSGTVSCVLLTIIFVVLKLTGVVNWPWIWVVSPLWIPLAIVLGFVFMFVVLAFIFDVRAGRL